jgi:hypothetical protein
MFKLLSLLTLLLALSAGMAYAAESTLSRDNGVAGDLVSQESDAHYINLQSPAGWKSVFAESVNFYGQRYGDVQGLKGTVVIWVPQTPPKNVSRSKYLGALKLLYSKQFDLSLVPEQAGWVELPIDPVSLPPAFAVSLYTYSTDQRGVKIALGGAPAGRPDSYSSSTHPGADGLATSIKFRHDGRDWMLRLKVRDTLAPSTVLDSASLTGPRFSAYDDGSAENYFTFQKNGCLLRCTNSGPRDIDSVYVYGKLDGHWLGTTRNASILILGEDLKVLGRAKLAYSSYTNVPSWNTASFSPVHVGPVFYIAVQPVSTPDVKLLVGVDSSSANKASYFGTSGSIMDWNLDLPKDTTNWMIRGHYTK